MAEASGVGLEIDLKKIPIRQETVEICEYFDVNPYGLISSGMMLMASADGNALVLALQEAGILATVIGKATEGNDRVIIRDEERRFWNRQRRMNCIKSYRKMGKMRRDSMREKILSYIETNSRIDMHDLAIMMGTDEATIMNELEEMEQAHIICGYHTLINWEKAGIESNSNDRSARYTAAWHGI